MSPARRRTRGFTLVEVMVALVIASLGLAAVITVAIHAVDNANVFRDRALALYIGLNVITELRLGDDFPEESETTDDVEFATREWLYTARVIATEVETLRRVEVDVALAERPDDIVRTVTGFVGEPVPGSTAASNTAWQGLVFQ